MPLDVARVSWSHDPATGMWSFFGDCSPETAEPELPADVPEEIAADFRRERRRSQREWGRRRIRQALWTLRMRQRFSPDTTDRRPVRRLLPAGRPGSSRRTRRTTRAGPARPGDDPPPDRQHVAPRARS